MAPETKPSRQTRKLKHEILQLLESESFAEYSIRISRKALRCGTNHSGECDPTNKFITINPHKGNFLWFIDTVVHELLHCLHPRTHERIIIRWSANVVADLSPTEMTGFLAAIFQHVVWDE